eukprot:CAMPEP_0177545600 /NCGR_PEP_ID=MMETSP0369-20130122/62706_1 /TAXON_ID=447022 ORGANISM="Scrippsiella hangoei-like, Strain SHHI-4" /NCGR_SAMPLE_ID=MMETSP0369 /ASSEMBLY_ACC=CAM_ASM_000364 /LENGTH=173 /DNA_ID=CAMNT_0019029907 /DNA_START=33 /DNA_END=554 /DNA_ORIENTATION=+
MVWANRLPTPAIRNRANPRKTTALSSMLFLCISILSGKGRRNQITTGDGLSDMMSLQLTTLPLKDFPASDAPGSPMSSSPQAGAPSVSPARGGGVPEAQQGAENSRTLGNLPCGIPSPDPMRSPTSKHGHEDMPPLPHDVSKQSLMFSSHTSPLYPSAQMQPGSPFSSTMHSP